MGTLFISGLLLLVAIVIPFVIPRESRDPAARKLRVVGPVILSLAGIIAFGLGCFTEVQEGNIGVMKTFGKAENEPREPGLNMHMPWQTIEPISFRDTRFHDTFDCMSKDLQEVTVEMTLVYARQRDQIPAIYKRVGAESENVDVKPGALEVLKASTADYDAAQLIENREELSTKVRDGIRTWIAPKGLTLIDCSIADVKFTPDYQKAVEAKQIALEAAKKALNERQEAVTRAEIRAAQQKGEANAAIETARGAAESAKLAADAKAYQIGAEAKAESEKISLIATAESNRIQMLREQLAQDPTVVQLFAIEAWKVGGAQVPQFNAGGTAFPFNLMMNLPVQTANTNTSGK